MDDLFDDACVVDDDNREPTREGELEKAIHWYEEELSNRQELVDNPDQIPLHSDKAEVYWRRLRFRGWLSKITSSERAVLAYEFASKLEIESTWAKCFASFWGMNPKTLTSQYTKGQCMGHYKLLEEWVQHALDEELTEKRVQDWRKNKWLYDDYASERDKAHSEVLSKAHTKEVKKEKKKYYHSRR